jgi:hypothetical protein
MFKSFQGLDVGSIPIARPIYPIDAVGLTGSHPKISLKPRILDAVGRGISRRKGFVRGIFPKSAAYLTCVPGVQISVDHRLDSQMDSGTN